VLTGLGFIVAGVWLLLNLDAHNGLWPALSLPKYLQYIDNEHKVGKTYTIKDQKGLLVTKVSHRVMVGDEVITSEGKRYRVHKVGFNSAIARFMGMDSDLLAYSEHYSKMVLPAVAPLWSNRPVAIYHTHTDESYLPSDGRISIPFHGGIIQVGNSYKINLSREGARVIHDITPHDPHDNNAYYRSRRTAFQLLKKNPLALFDVHRDGVDDPEFYREYIANKNVAQIRIVVGRQNPHMAANLDFAKRIMTYTNKIHPKVVKEIYMANGNYNQDLLSTSLLLEAGTYTNSKEEAIKGVDLLADAVPIVLGITIPPEKSFTKPEERGSGVWPALVYIIILTIIGGGAFVIVNAGDLNEVKKLMSNFYRNELSGIVGPLARKIPLELWWNTVYDKKLKPFPTPRKIIIDILGALYKILNRPRK